MFIEKRGGDSPLRRSEMFERRYCTLQTLHSCGVMDLAPSFSINIALLRSDLTRQLMGLRVALAFHQNHVDRLLARLNENGRINELSSECL